jgi:phosphoribosylaminoimidazole-succinocarboxamide synthase
MSETVFESKLRSLDLVYRGKVRDVYAVDDRRLLILVSDRLSAFDVVMPIPSPARARCSRRSRTSGSSTRGTSCRIT